MLATGEIVAGGDFATSSGASCIARWNGSAWLPLGAGTNGRVAALARLPNGDLVAGGDFTTAGGVSAHRLARWNGTSWSAFGGGTDRLVADFATSPSGDLIVGGTFRVAGGRVALGLARLTTPCPAVAAPLGSGCSSAAGPMVLTPSSLPWAGGTFHATCTGIAANPPCFGLLGFASPGTALASFHPAGGVGCHLLASPDAVLLLPPGVGSVSSQFVLPGTVAIAGLVVNHQVLQIELGAAGDITQISGSNGLALTIGAF